MPDSDSLYHRLFAHPRMVEGLVREFVPWRLVAELVREACAGCGVRLSESVNLLEVKSMLATTFKIWREQWLAEGAAKGKAEGKAEALICLLAERFGAVAPSCQKRIRAAKLVTLERWFKRAITATDLPSVFKPPR